MAWKTTYGDKPISLHVFTAFELFRENEHNEVTVTLELWNMQRYPIVFEYGIVTLGDWDVRDETGAKNGPITWVQQGRSKHYHGDRQRIEPNSNLLMTIKFMAKPPPRGTSTPTLLWRFDYYDPSRQKTMKLHGSKGLPGQHFLHHYEINNQA